MPAKLSIEKRDYYKLISARLKKLKEESGYENKDILDIARRKNLILSSSYLSKMLATEDPSISLPDLVSVASIFNVDLNDLLSFNKHLMPTFRHIEDKSEDDKAQQKNFFITDPTDPRMKPYIGKYHTYFFHTSANTSSLIKGTLQIASDESNKKTIASLEFPTGKKDNEGNPIKKKYTGIAIISPGQQAVYISLISNKLGEISNIMFHYIPIMNEELLCRVALALTSSSGDNFGSRAPTAHRMILSRYDLEKKSSDVLEKMKGLLYMNQNEILISEKDLSRFMENAPKEFQEYYKPHSDNPNSQTVISGFSPVPYYLLSESSLRSGKLDEQILNDSIDLLQQYSAGERNHKVPTQDDANLYVSLLNWFPEEDIPSSSN